MFLDDILKGTMLDKLETIINDLESHVSFVNTAGDAWNVVISFNLSELSDVDKAALTAILKFL